MRGLKLPFTSILRIAPIVASYMGAWIETYTHRLTPDELSVASYMGAWIETTITIMIMSAKTSSHPTWVRGLKLYP